MYKISGYKLLTASQAFAAVQAFVAGAVANHDIAAVGTGRRVLLVGNHLGQGEGAGTLSARL